MIIPRIITLRLYDAPDGKTPSCIIEGFQSQNLDGHLDRNLSSPYFGFMVTNVSKGECGKIEVGKDFFVEQSEGAKRRISVDTVTGASNHYNTQIIFEYYSLDFNPYQK